MSRFDGVQDADVGSAGSAAARTRQLWPNKNFIRWRSGSVRLLSFGGKNQHLVQGTRMIPGDMTTDSGVAGGDGGGRERPP